MTKNSLPDIVFFGTPDFAVASLAALKDNNFNILAVVTAPDKPSGRGRKLRPSAVKEYAEQKNIPILQPTKLRDEAFLLELKNLNADLFIVVAFRMLPQVVWDMPPMGTINLHGSLLPKYRGAAPINHAIINGETKTGVTTFQLKHEIDTGNILLQKEIDILPEDNFGSLYLKLMQIGATLLVDTVQKLSEGIIHPIPQPENTGNLPNAPKIFKEDCEINWENSAKNIHNFIRGLAPIPTAFTLINGQKFKIFESKFSTSDTNADPGSINTDNKTFLKIATQDGWVEILILQPEGKKAMQIRDFFNGNKI